MALSASFHAKLRRTRPPQLSRVARARGPRMASSPNNPPTTGEPNDRLTATGGARSRVAGEADEPAAGRPANGQTVVVAVRPAADAATNADAGEAGTDGAQGAMCAEWRG